LKDLAGQAKRQNFLGARETDLPETSKDTTGEKSAVCENLNSEGAGVKRQ